MRNNSTLRRLVQHLPSVATEQENSGTSLIMQELVLTQEKNTQSNSYDPGKPIQQARL